MTAVGTSVEGPPGAGSEHIRRIRGDLLACNEVDAIVNAVNCVGVMGKGIALQFKRRWPTNFTEYASACKAGAVRPGKMLVHHLVGRLLPRYIVNFPTKAHWREPSRIEFVRDGLGDLVAQIQNLQIRTIAIPALGCGNGGLDWSDIRPLIELAFAPLPTRTGWISSRSWPVVWWMTPRCATWS